MASDAGIVAVTELRSERLRLRGLVANDAPFILELVNEPSWLRFIGDRGVRNLDDARAYIANGPQASYARHGFGLYLVERAADAAPLGLCGLLKRDALEHADIGFAFSPRHWGQGYAGEAARAVLADARDRLGLARVLAITNPDNAASIGLLEKAGFRFQRRFRLPGEESEVKLFELAFPLSPGATSTLSR